MNSSIPTFRETTDDKGCLIRGRGSLHGGGGPVSVVLPGPKLALNGPAP